MKIMNVKGGYDFLPKEQKIRNYINDTLRKIFEEYGYNAIETPILCYYDILSDKYDKENDILKEIYKLSDQGERELGLRYDLTVPFAKFIALNKNKIQMPFKRYEIDKVFRDGPVKIGRNREFTQCDVDVVGLSGQLIEAELMTLFKRAFDEFDIDIYIEYNSRNLMNGLILESNVDEKLLPKVTTIIDKKKKITTDEFKIYLKELALTDEQINQLNNNLNLNLEKLNKKFNNTSNEYIKIGLIELNNLFNYINKLGLSDICIFTPSLARGQNYYTGNVFEVFDKKQRITGSIGAGGRYDKMITNFIDDGEEYPTVGISFGLSSIYEILKDSDLFEDKSNIDIYIIPMDTNIECLKLANNLRIFGYKVEIEMQDKKLKKSLNYANKEKIPFVIVLGENELKNNKFNLKDMFNNKEITINLDNLSKIKEIIK